MTIGAVIADAISDMQNATIDACTLNNALNIAQLVVLFALLKWARSDERS